MKTVILVRHAKSSWKETGIADFERSLNSRGRKDAPFMGKLIADKGIRPDLIYSSPAKRAWSTAKYFAEALNYPQENIQKELLIYDYGPNQIMEMISNTDDNHQTIMIFGHNPDFTALASHMSGRPFDNVPTCGVVCVDYNCHSWREIPVLKGALRLFEYPGKYDIT